MSDKEAIIKLRSTLQLVLDQVDYTRGACGLTTMVGAALDSKILDIAHKVIEDTKP